jgi:hypothetical protein
VRADAAAGLAWSAGPDSRYHGLVRTRTRTSVASKTIVSKTSVRTLGRSVARAALVVLVLLSVSARADDRRTELFKMRSRAAADLVEVLRPLAGSEGEVFASQGRLVVHASPAALQQIRRALEDLDPPPRALWITVSQEQDAATTGRSAEFTVETTREDGVLERRRTRTLAGGTVPADRSEAATAATEPLRVLEGHAAVVRMTRAVPLPSTGPVSSAQGTIVVPGRSFVDGEIAFGVVPRLADDQVTLEITIPSDTVDNRGDVEVQRGTSKASGRLGQWLGVGEAIRAASLPSGILSTDQRLSELRTLVIKVEDAR